MIYSCKCFIEDNSPELIKELLKFRKKILWPARKGQSKYTICAKTVVFSDDKPIPPADGYIDCKKNKDLFLALAALNNENDFRQWFVLDEGASWVNLDTYCPTGSFEFCLFKKNMMALKCHKATVNELIKHFHGCTPHGCMS